LFVCLFVCFFVRLLLLLLFCVLAIAFSLDRLSQQSVASIITTAMMFGGAIATAVLYRALSW
jgi:hypothetical protein